MTKDLPSPDLLRKLLRYEPDTGKLFWLTRSPDIFGGGAVGEEKCRLWNPRFSGKEAFCTVRSDGYMQGKIFDRPYFAHRVAWAIATGGWPQALIDHINGNKADNRIANLREATKSENAMNAGARAFNSAGMKGAHKNGNAWSSQITLNGKRFYLGHFATADEAHKAYCNAAKKLHGKFRRVR